MWASLLARTQVIHLILEVRLRREAAHQLCSAEDRAEAALNSARSSPPSIRLPSVVDQAGRAALARGFDRRPYRISLSSFRLPC